MGSSFFFNTCLTAYTLTQIHIEDSSLYYSLFYLTTFTTLTSDHSIDECNRVTGDLFEWCTKFFGNIPEMLRYITQEIDFSIHRLFIYIQPLTKPPKPICSLPFSPTDIDRYTNSFSTPSSSLSKLPHCCISPLPYRVRTRSIVSCS